MSTEHVETLIVGAGQSGLATAHHLRAEGRECLVVDAHERVGDGWRQQWDTLRLFFSPARADGLPGMPFPAPPWSFPGKDEMADYLEAYAEAFALPVRMNTPVGRVSRTEQGYTAELGAHTIIADNVVVATGTFGRTPLVPDLASDLDPRITQLHSSDYRRPSQLRPGAVLVVGASHSGLDIAYEVGETHPTLLCGRDTGAAPLDYSHETAGFRFKHRAMRFVFMHVLTRRTPMGRKVMADFRTHGGPALRVQPRDLAARGVERVTERVTGVDDGLPRLADDRMVDVANVVWCTGFRQSFGWVDLPVFDDDGWPREQRGVVQESPGLYFCGLGFQYCAASMLIAGVARDSAHVAAAILQRAPRRSPAAA